MQVLKSVLSDTLHLFYPHNCTGCGSDLVEKDNLLCLKCISILPHTNFAQYAGNATEAIFWGRLPLSAAHSEFYFIKESLVQHLMHQLKYKNNQQIGAYLGEMMGKSLLNSNRFSHIDALVPLPLYPDKERQRGYNQAAVICNGIAAVTNIPVITGNIIRQRPTDTQAKKHNRIERWENVEGSFVVKYPEKLKGKSLLLVDDIITTGATLEACGHVILNVADTRLSIATLARAGK